VPPEATLSPAGAALAGGVVAVTTSLTTLLNNQRRGQEAQGERPPTKSNNESEPTSPCTTPGESSYDKKLGGEPPSGFIPRAVPEFSGLRPQAARDPPVRVSHGGGSGFRIHVPFPFSVPIAAGHLLHSIFSSSDDESSAAYVSEREKTSAPAASSARTSDSAYTAMPPPDDGQDGDTDDGQDGDTDDGQDSDTDTGKLLKASDLKSIWENLKMKGAADFGTGSSRTIWKNRDFRVDAGFLKDGVRHWEFQVNGSPVSRVGKRLLGRYGTHEKLFKGAFDTKNVPEFEEWKRAVLDTLSRL